MGFAGAILGAVFALVSASVAWLSWLSLAVGVSASATGALLSLAAPGGTRVPTPGLSPSSTAKLREGSSGATVSDLAVKMQPLLGGLNRGGPDNPASIACFSC